jgi:hypothetical protein
MLALLELLELLAHSFLLFIHGYTVIYLKNFQGEIVTITFDSVAVICDN